MRLRVRKIQAANCEELGFELGFTGLQSSYLESLAPQPGCNLMYSYWGPVAPAPPSQAVPPPRTLRENREGSVEPEELWRPGPGFHTLSSPVPSGPLAPRLPGPAGISEEAE